MPGDPFNDIEVTGQVEFVMKGQVRHERRCRLQTTGAKVYASVVIIP
jgi:hypothetical protein